MADKATIPVIEHLRGFLQYKVVQQTPFLAETIHDAIADYFKLVEAHDAMAERVRQLEAVEGSRRLLKGSSAASSTNGAALSAEAMEEIYGFVKSRAGKDPGVLELLTHRPELRVKVERQIVEMDDSTIIGRIARLIHDGYFKQPKNGPTVQKELKRRGCDQPTTNLYKPLNRLTEMGFLTLEPDGFQAVEEMKVQVVGGRG